MSDYIYMTITSVKSITDNSPFWSYDLGYYLYSGKLVYFYCEGMSNEWDMCSAIADHFDVVGDFSFDVIRKKKRTLIRGNCVFLFEQPFPGAYKIPLY